MCNTCNAFENHAGQFDNEPYPNLLPVTQLNVLPLVQDEVLNGSEKDIGTIKQGMACVFMYLYAQCGQEKLHYIQNRDYKIT